jgi:hypothetical protein
MFVVSSHGKKMKEQKQWVREEEERMMRREVEEEGHKIKGEGGAGWRWGILCLVLSGVAVGEARNTHQLTQTFSSRVIVTSLTLTLRPRAVAPHRNACSG